MYFIGIDGGGTTSDYVLLNEKNEVLAQAVDGPTNINSCGKDEVYKHIENGLKKLLENFFILQDDLMVTLSTAGVDRPEDKLPYKDILIKLGYNNFLVTNDAEAALSAGTHGENGIIVIAGTGSIVIGKNENVVKRVGGWGHILGDEGSAYKISIEAIRMITQFTDGYGEKTSLEKRLLKAINGCSSEDFLKFIYQQTFKKDVIADLAKIVDEACEAGDEVAKKILVKEANLLSKQVIALHNKLFDDSKVIPVILNGSVMKKCKTFYNTFCSALKGYPFELIVLNVDASVGAAYLGQKKVNDEKSIC